ncbi:MAG: cell division protein FtsQ/DivIB [Maritimibacter sp.]
MQPLRAIGPHPSQTHVVRHDPSPSRWAYRFHRLWLTPLYRALMRVGIPTFLLITIAGWYFTDAERSAAVMAKIDEMRQSVETRPEFMVKLMSIEGTDPVVADAIRAMVGVELPASSFDLDLDVLRAQIAALDVVKSVNIHIRPGGVMQVAVTERVPALVWRAPGGIELLDETGHRVAGLTKRDARPDLPLIAGRGADRAVPEALALITAAAPMRDELRGLVRVGERRWNLVLSNDRTIMLPETEPESALDLVLALDHAQDLLSRDVSYIDMRNPKRPTLRLDAPAVETFREINSLALETAR